jgi:phthalate 4,5-cis-dihydrodiol dehydrogenase
MNTLRLGISGLGSAATFMIRAAVEDPRIVLAAAADPLLHPRDAFARDFKATTYECFDDLCRDPALDAIYVASPHEFHATQAVLALQHGKHVVLEKPLALTLADCDEVVRAVSETGKVLIVGHTHAFDPSVEKIRELAAGGEFGRLGMILNFNYTDFLYRPRRPEELDTARGGGIVFNQVSHQVEIARSIAGSRVRSVRANVGRLDSARPTEGNSSVFLDFDNGAAASLVYSSYDYFDSDELFDWVGELGLPKQPYTNGRAKRLLASATSSETERRREVGYGSRSFQDVTPQQPHFGLLVATFERGEIRTTPQGLAVYGHYGRSEIKLENRSNMPGHRNVLNALWKAVREGQPCAQDARWGKATLEIALAILESDRERREVMLGGA